MQKNFKVVTKADIAAMVNQEIGLSKRDSVSIINELLNTIKLALAEDGIVKIPSFGTFKVRKKRARIGRVPNTLQEALIAERHVVSFYLSNVLRKLINENK
ncbi:integration host factor subunit alpha [Wolbachia endosymbiont of Pentidionis agamae]|uniref:integration host factor subunit alpha n=1 Tax=Wolbachia endosymbiont of Pentidionis agamae TaxID=3110435 RepID=UPI002FD6C69D